MKLFKNFKFQIPDDDARQNGVSGRRLVPLPVLRSHNAAHDTGADQSKLRIR